MKRADASNTAVTTHKAIVAPHHPINQAGIYNTIGRMEGFTSSIATNNMSSLIGICILLLSSSTHCNAFTAPIFQESAALQKTAPSKTKGIEIELPDFDEFFNRIQIVSPLAKLAFEGGGSGEGGGFAKVDDTCEYILLSIL